MMTNKELRDAAGTEALEAGPRERSPFLFPERGGRVKVLSSGGGLDSFGMLLNAIDRGEFPDYLVHVDTGYPGDPGEWPSTKRHLEEVVKPICEEHGIKYLVIDGDSYPVRGARSLFAWLEGDRGPGKDRAKPQIPVCGPNRICTFVAKTERFGAWLDDTFPGQEVEVWIAFEAGEEGRADRDPNAGKARKADPSKAIRINRFPLIEEGLCRCRCEELSRAHGYPVPRKSACTFCPYGSRADWKTFAKQLPEDFVRVAALEAAKPATSSGKKLSIMGYRMIKLSKPAHAALDALDTDPAAKVRTPTLASLVRHDLLEAAGSGYRLTAAGEKALEEGTGAAIGYVAPPVTEYIRGRDRTPPAKPCEVCGAAVKATKATGCDYLED